MSKILGLVLVGLLVTALVVIPAVKEQTEVPAALSSASSHSQVSSDIPSWLVEKFNSWKNLNHKFYGSEEIEMYRMAIYYSNFIYIQMTNAEQQDFELGENQFMDLSQDEWAAQYLTIFPEGYDYPEQDNEEYNAPTAAFQWGSATTGPVLNQGSCGSCWAFSATETVQSFWQISKGTLPLLSEQQLVDCSGSYGNQGCNGGWPSWALNYVKANGLTTNAAYPYTARDGSCKINSGAYKISRVQTNAGCTALTNDIKSQPTSVCVDATNWSFYRSGVFSNCGTNINHAVLGIGWDAAGNWIIQNSWGTSWGQAGKITLKSGNTCAVCNVLANAY